MKKVLCALLTCTIIALSCSVGFGANWQKVYSSYDYVVYIDGSSLRSKGDTFVVTERWRFCSHKSQAEIGLYAAFVSPGNDVGAPVQGVFRKEYRKSKNENHWIDGELYDSSGRFVCPVSSTNWDKTTKEETAVRNACLRKLK